MELVDGVWKLSVEEKLVIEKGGELMGIPPLPPEEEETSFEDVPGVSDTPPAVWYLG